MYIGQSSWSIMSTFSVCIDAGRSEGKGIVQQLQYSSFLVWKVFPRFQICASWSIPGMTGNNSSFTPPPEWSDCMAFYPPGRSDHSNDVLVSLVNALCAVFAIVSNTLAIVTFCKTKALHTPFNVFLCSLAVTDVFTGLVAQPFFIARHLALKHTRENCTYLKVEYFLEALCSGGTNLNTVIISCDRCVAYWKPTFYKDNVTIRRCIQALVVTWLFWIGAQPLVLLLTSPERMSHLFAATLLIFIGTPLVANIGTALALRRFHSTIAPAGEGAQQPEAIYARERKATVILFLITAALIVTMTPSVVILATFGRSNEAAYMWAVTLIFLNSSLNPLIYTWSNEKFRKAALRIMQAWAGVGRSCLLTEAWHSG